MPPTPTKRKLPGVLVNTKGWQGWIFCAFVFRGLFNLPSSTFPKIKDCTRIPDLVGVIVGLRRQALLMNLTCTVICLDFCERPFDIELTLFVELRNPPICIVKHLRKVKDETQPIKQPHFYPFGPFFILLGINVDTHSHQFLFVFFNEENLDRAVYSL